MRTKRSPILAVCFGDSLTEGNSNMEDGQWPTRLQSLLDQSQPAGFEVCNRGKAGDTSAQGLDRIGDAVLSLSPDRVVIAFGINDCNVRSDRRTPRVGSGEFTSNLREMIRMVRAVDSTPILLSPHYPELDQRVDGSKKYDQGNGTTYADNFRPYHLAMRRVARKEGATLIDLPKLMVRERVKVADFLTEDGVHLTAEGNRFYAEQVWRHLST